MRILKRLAILAPIALVVLAGTVWLPWYSVGPGPAREIQPLIQVEGHPEYASTGRFVMTSIRFDRLTPFGAFFAWIDPHRAVVPRSELFAPGQTPQQERQRAISLMDQSKLDATYVALSELTGYPREHRRGALVESVVEGCAAYGELYPGDLILAIDGRPIRGAADASRAIEAAPPGSTLAFDVRAGGE
ncbi:MAG TPA: PDZ domain-containing protein, partial [Actinomycetota bacterium]